MIGRPVLEPRAFLPTINVAALLFIAPCLVCYEFYSKGAPMAARIAPAVAPYSPSVQEELNKLMGPGRDPLVLFTTLARDERLFKKFFASGLLERGNLTLREREIVIDRTTALCHSEYEWGVHVSIFGQKADLTEDQIQSLAFGQADDACWGWKESLLIRFCDELHETSTISEGLWVSLRRGFSEAAIIELLMVAGFYHTVSYLTNSLRLPLEAFARRFTDVKSSSQTT